jgi:hypothetical protein
MMYFDSDRMIQVGDKVRYAGSPGVIVFVIDNDSYSDRYRREDWSYLGKGFGVQLEDGTLFHFEFPDEDLEPAGENEGTKPEASSSSLFPSD